MLDKYPINIANSPIIQLMINTTVYFESFR